MEIINESQLEDIINKYFFKNKELYLLEKYAKLISNIKYKITDDSEIKTAAVKRINGKLHYIFFNRKFLEKSIETYDDLFFVFLHETHHIINGDLIRWNPMINFFYYNVIFDIKINSQIIKDFFKEGYHFLNKFYPDKEMVLNFLLSPNFRFDELNKVYADESLQKKILKKIKKMKFKDEYLIKDKNKFAELYIEAWFKKTSADKLYFKFKEAINTEKLKNIEIILLGSHKGIGNGLYMRFGNEIELDDMVKKDNREQIIKVIKKIFEEDREKQIKDVVSTIQRRLIPNVGRRESFLLYKNIYPVFFPNQIYDECPTYKGTNIYIDVSGSFKDELSFIYKLIESVKDFITEPIYIFSEYVTTIDFEELKNGKVKTSFGTDFDEVLMHAFENNFKKILVITDGVGIIKEENKINAIKKKMEIYLVLLEESEEYVNPWEEIALKKFVLRKNDL